MLLLGTVNMCMLSRRTLVTMVLRCGPVRTAIASLSNGPLSVVVIPCRPLVSGRPRLTAFPVFGLITSPLTHTLGVPRK